MVLEPEDKALGNLRARIRMNVLYYYANLKNLLVLGSSDKSEYQYRIFYKIWRWCIRYTTNCIIIQNASSEK